ncbi:hypothetical protein [Streptomyces sp. NPDC005955]|uniref:hypothetical protein n=1 Tax=Streptomyces sp. NPDC005955 TaxID=3364738 RepID=UPI0036791068
MVVFAGFLAGRREEPLEARERFAVLLYEPYWMLGGLLFAALAASFQRRTRRPPDQDA